MATVQPIVPLWFVGMEMDQTVWNHAVYSKNQERLLNEEIAESFLPAGAGTCQAVHVG